eukprot:TRINITY_DN84_c0_g1_i2.p3 TRINITY_DN84_c0_g1~~TRINITY_DN84_c0_g1_i2.p3  ORF type:complete len:146 (-),score=27.36 TRINITY_DN84_c0_g1_i2:67-459(-)
MDIARAKAEIARLGLEADSKLIVAALLRLPDSTRFAAFGSDDAATREALRALAEGERRGARPAGGHHLETFPGAVGLTGEAARAHVLAQNAALSVQLVPAGSPVTMDLRSDRVRIFVEADGTVRSVPRVG